MPERGTDRGATPPQVQRQATTIEIKAETFTELISIPFPSTAINSCPCAAIICHHELPTDANLPPGKPVELFLNHKLLYRVAISDIKSYRLALPTHSVSFTVSLDVHNCGERQIKEEEEEAR